MAETAIGERLERSVRRRGAEAAARAAVKMETALKAAFQVHRDTGETQRSITVRLASVTATRIEYLARVTTKQAKWVNDGTPPHPITPRKPGGVLRFKWAGAPAELVSKDGYTYLRSVSHPGYKGDGWWDDTIQQWHEFLQDGLAASA